MVGNFLQKKVTADVSLDEASQDYAASVMGLPLLVSERIERPDTEESVDVDNPFSWCVCEMPEGDFPRVRVFSEFDALARHVGKLEGQEVSVWIFYGTPISLTEKDDYGDRYLKTSRQEAFKVPTVPTGVALAVSSSQVSQLHIQEDGWLGDPSLTESATSTYYAREAPQDDEFDPDDDDQGEPLGI